MFRTNIPCQMSKDEIEGLRSKPLEASDFPVHYQSTKRVVQLVRSLRQSLDKKGETALSRPGSTIGRPCRGSIPRRTCEEHVIFLGGAGRGSGVGRGLTEYTGPISSVVFHNANT